MAFIYILIAGGVFSLTLALVRFSEQLRDNGS